MAQGPAAAAGDACHQTPPFMGQGMCAGTRDVANLYWKLSLVCQGKVAGEAAERLLDTYESERKPNAREYITTAVRLGGLINNCGTQAALQAALPAAGGSARMESIAPSLGPGLGKGEKAGRLLGQPHLADNRPMDDLMKHRFVVVTQPDLVKDLPLPAGVGLVTTADSPDAAEHLARMDTRAAVLRPDRHTLGCADTQQELAALLALIVFNPAEAQEPEMI